MKKLILFICLILGTTCLYAQSEVPADSVHRLPPTVKQYGDFLIDMGLFAASPVQMPNPSLNLYDASKDYNRIFRLNPDFTMTQGFTYAFAPTYSSGYAWEFGSFSSTPQYLQMGSFKLKNGMRLNTYGEYDADGRKVPNPSALPWEKNNFKGGFELKSGNGAFGIRIEVQQGRGTPYYPY